MLQKVAHDAYESVRAAHADFIAENGVDYDECEIYLYVARNGTWAIDHAQYFTSFPVWAYAPLAAYASATNLYWELDGSTF